MTELPVSEKLYETYASTHAGWGDGSDTALIYRRDIRPHLPFPASGRRVLDIGCGQGGLVRLLAADGFDAHGVDISPEQVEIAHAAGLSQIRLGDFHRLLDGSAGTWDAVVATDLLEHLSKDDVWRTFDEVRRSLRPGGVFLARVPNAVSPTGGHLMYGDFTHETWFTRRSVAQLAAVAGFSSVRVLSCPPVAHGIRSALRVAVWKGFSGLVKVAMAAETGQLRGHIVTQNLTFVAHRDEAPHPDEARGPRP
jgi:2-polyprenyl-3-methyl-5-hydroxy-6-metoxy-1,4-benzoquinol methylase